MERIIRVPVLPLGLVNAHVIVGRRGCVLVDAGLPGTEKKVHTALKRNGLDLEDIKLIIVTHAHVDHAGNAARMRQLTRAPILAHVGDLPYYLRERAMTFCATGIFGKLFLQTGLMYEPYDQFMPDILLRDGECISLREWGIEGTAQHTPGHTAGSITVQLARHHMFVGDLLASGVALGGIACTGRPKRPPFEDDPVMVATQLRRLLDVGGQAFYLGHGGPLSARQVERHVRRLLDPPTSHTRAY